MARRHVWRAGEMVSVWMPRKKGFWGLIFDNDSGERGAGCSAECSVMRVTWPMAREQTFATVMVIGVEE